MASIPQTPYMASDLSPDVYQAALASQMGEQPRAEYRPKTSVVNMVLGIGSILLGLIFVVSGMVAAGQSTDSSGPVSLLVFGLLGLLLIGGGLFLTLLGVIYKNWRVYLYDRGFVYKGGSKAAAQPFRWDQIETAWYSVIRRSYYGVFTITYHYYRVRRIDGYEVKLNDRFANVAELGEVIHNQVVAVKLPQVIAAYNAGQTITFGPFSVSRQGITNASGKLLPWPEIRGIAINQGYVRINRAGKWLRWSSKPVKDIPNVFLFAALVRNILNQKR